MIEVWCCSHKYASSPPNSQACISSSLYKKEEFIGFVNKLEMYTEGWKLKIDQLVFQLPTLDWLKIDVGYIYSAQCLLSKPKTPSPCSSAKCNNNQF